MKCLWKNNFRLNKALVAVGINIGLTSGSISIHVWQWNGRRIVLSNFRLSFNIHAEIRSFRRFGGSETGGKKIRVHRVSCRRPLVFISSKSKIKFKTNRLSHRRQCFCNILTFYLDREGIDF